MQNLALSDMNVETRVPSLLTSHVDKIFVNCWMNNLKLFEPSLTLFESCLDNCLGLMIKVDYEFFRKIIFTNVCKVDYVLCLWFTFNKHGREYVCLTLIEDTHACSMKKS